MDRVFEYKIPSVFDGANVMAVLKRHYKMSTMLIKELRRSEDGLVLNEEHIRTVDRVREGDVLRVTLHDSLSRSIKPVNIPVNIVYEDEDILVVSKPAGMPTHISVGNYDNSLANAVMYHFLSKGEERTFRAVNRLDKYTSGLMTVAKNAYAHARLAEKIHTDSLVRKYKCIVCGETEPSGVVDAPIKRAEGSALARTVAPDGQRAVTHYKTLELLDGYSLLEIRLETGRTHQIRVHMAYIGHPLAGDWLYGEENHQIAKRQMLHSYYLRFNHPVTGGVIELEMPMPEDMSDFINKRRKK